MSAGLATRPALKGLGLGDLPMIRQLNAEDRLIDFIKLLWPTVEPTTEFVPGWAIEAVCDHLEGVAAGHIKRLIINVPPGFMKSMATCVFLPGWLWGPRNRPATRFLCASYSSSLTERDNGRTCQLIHSPEYRAMWGSRFSANDSKVRISTNKTGWKLATSVGGVGTGERADIILCLPFDGEVLTDRGWLKIGEVVCDRLDVRVAGWSGSVVEWQSITAYETNPAAPLIEIEHDFGRLRCTPEHPVWIEGRGYIPAEHVRSGDTLLIAEEYEGMRALRERVPGQAGAYGEQEVLLPCLPGYGADKHGQGEQFEAMFDVREDDIPAARAPSAHPKWPVLQPQVPWNGQPGGSKPGISCWARDDDLRCVPDANCSRCGQGADVLHQSLCCDWPCAPSSGDLSGSLRRVREDIPPRQPWGSEVLTGLQECSSLAPDEGVWQWALRAWGTREAISFRLDQILQRRDPGTRRPQMPSLPDHAGRTRQTTVRPSHRLRENQSEPPQPNHGVPVVPRQDARPTGKPTGVAVAVVRDVRWLLAHAETTFNVRVEPHHNYFADGVLVHNCDDPNSVREAESSVIRTNTNQWASEVLPTRLNSPRESAIVIIQQRTHEEDVTGMLLKADLGYEHLMIPMQWDGRRYYTSIGWTDPRSIEDVDPDNEDRLWFEIKGELAFPERFPAWVVERDQKAMGSYASAGQFQQMPVPRGGGIIKREWWQQWGPDDPRGVKFPPFDLVVAFYDGAYTTKTQNDPSALAVLGTFVDPYSGMPKLMLARCWSERLALNDAVMRIDETARKYRVSLVLVENKANGHSVVQELHRLFKDKPYSVVLVDPGGTDKVARAMSVVPVFEDEMIYAPNTEWAVAAIDECTIFPRGSHDDQVDAIVGGIRWLRDNGMLKRVVEVMTEERDFMMDEDSKGRLQPLYQT